MFTPVPPKPDFPNQERDILRFWETTRAFEKLRQLRRGGPTWSFMDGPITANNPMGVHHAWGRTYKDLWQRYYAMRGFDQRWQNGFDCQGLWVEVNVEKDLGFKNKKDIEAYGLAEFIILCKQRVLHYAAIQTEQSMRLGNWMDWNDPDMLRRLRDRLGEDPQAQITVQGAERPVTCTVEGIVGRLGLPELGGSYFTFSDKNNYDIWLFLKTCHDHGWIYKGTDVMPWCWRCGTGISQHEIVTEGYFEKQDPGLTVRFPLVDRPGESLLVWTTTPWTLPSNVVAAVGPELTYVKVSAPKAGGGEEVLYLSKGTTHMLQGKYTVLEELPGKALEGWRYAGPFDELPANQHPGGWAEPTLRRLFAGIPDSAAQAHRVVLWDEVGEAEGTGIVHIAPGAGAEDFLLHKRDNLPLVAPLDENGFYIDGFDWLSGLPVAEVADRIVAALKENGRFYRLEPYTHRYPQCWRCNTPLVFRLVDEWFISMDGLRQPIMDVTNQIQWVPEFGRERELDWLRNMHDWMISKKRYWGLALPIWECKACGHFEVLGSPDELRQRAIAGWETFEGHTPHRPYIDAVVIACSNCGQPSHRIADVGNPWLDAGIVGLSTLRYGTEPEYWKKWYPADFITESFPGQFRNWFYSLLTMSTALTGERPTRAVLGFGTLLAEDGSAMHKSAGNSIEFSDAADSPDFGADVMRWLFAAQRYDVDLLFGVEHAKDVRRRFLLPLWNVYTFFVTYANLDGWKPEADSAASLNSLDLWILSRLNELIGEVTSALDDYLAYRSVRAIEGFVDDLSNWYVRRSRRRYWKSEADADKQAAYSTLYQVLVTLIKLVAPFIPFTAEVMYQNLVRRAAPDAPESVHHCDWPAVDSARLDRDLLEAMAIARTVVTLGHASRAGANLKVRQPLGRAVIVVAPEQGPRLMRLADVVADELNVKTVELASNEAELITYRLQPNNKLLGPKYGQRFPQVRAALENVTKFGGAAAVGTLRSGQTLNLQVGDEILSLMPEEVLVSPEPRPGFAVAAEAGVVVALDTAITPELRAEGLAREVVRRIQDLRKSAGFDIADRVTTTYSATAGLADAISKYQDYIRAETLSLELSPGEPPEGAAAATDSFDGENVTVGLVKAGSGAPAHPGARSPGEGEAAVAAIAANLADAGPEAVPQIPEGHTPETRAKEAARAAPRKRAGRTSSAKKSTAKKGARKVAVRKPAKMSTRKAADRKSAKKKKAVKKLAAKKSSAKKAGRKSTAKKSAARTRAKKTKK